LIKVPTGIIKVEFADNFVTPLVSQAYAKATFVSQGTLQTTQTTVVSTRPPIVTPKPQVVSRGTTTGGAVAPPPVYGGVPAADIGTPCWSVTSTNGGSSTSTFYPYTTEIDYLTPVATAAEPGVYNVYCCAGGQQFAVGGTAASQFVGAFVSEIVGSPVSQATIDYGLCRINNILGAATNCTMSGSETLAAAQFVTNEVLSGVSLCQAISDLSGIVSSYTGCLQALANCYIASNQGAYCAGVAAGWSAVCCAGCQTSVLDGTDPLSQNFFIDATKYPNGVFLSSVDLFFATVDPTIPVSVRIRPVVNGYPDAVHDIPGSIVFKNPQDINLPAASDTATLESGIGPATTFYFDHPVYIPAGQASILIASDSNQYTLYASKLGEVQYGTNNVVNAVTYAGSLFKSQNSSTWVPAPGETLSFVLKICDFAGGTTTYEVNSKTSPSIINYDLLNLITSDMSFNSLDSISYGVKTKDATTGIITTDPTPVLEGQNYQFATRQEQNVSGDIVIVPSLTNTDRWTTPVNDMQRLNTILVTNILTPYNSANTVQESLGGFGNGGAAARYITRRVTLDNNFASTGITVFMNVNRQPGTKIEVYYKVLNQYDKNNFDTQPYVLMSPIFTAGSSTQPVLPFTGATDYVSDTYQALNITYNDITTGATYKNFNVFAIKVCFYSDNPAIAPQIKNFRSIATA
jgi:hypothetical protein